MNINLFPYLESAQEEIYASVTDAGMEARIDGSGCDDVILEEDDGAYEMGDSFKSYRHQARQYLSYPAMLVGFLSVWLKKCVVSSPSQMGSPLWHSSRPSNWSMDVHSDCLRLWSAASNTGSNLSGGVLLGGHFKEDGEGDCRTLRWTMPKDRVAIHLLDGIVRNALPLGDQARGRASEVARFSHMRCFGYSRWSKNFVAKYGRWRTAMIIIASFGVSLTSLEWSTEKSSETKEPANRR